MSQVWRPSRKPRRQTRTASLSPRQSTQAALKACSRRVARGELGRPDAIGSRPCLGGNRPAAVHRPSDAALSQDEARTLCRGVGRIMYHQPQSTAAPWPATTLDSVLRKAFARHVGSEVSPCQTPAAPVSLHTTWNGLSSCNSRALLFLCSWASPIFWSTDHRGRP